MNRIMSNPSTNVDVDLLCTVFSDLLPDGREIRHEQIEALLSAPRLSNRYRLVVTKWRRRLFAERTVWLDGIAAQGRGFIALTPDEMVRFGSRGVRHAGRKLRKALAVLSAPADVALSEGIRKNRALLAVAIERIAHESKSALRDVTRALGPQQQLPRRQAS